MLNLYWARGRKTILLLHNLHAQVGRLERDVPLRSLQVGSHRQGVYNSPAGISYTAEKRTNNKKTKVMTTKEQETNPIQAQMKFRMPNGTDKYVTKTFNDKKHMRAYIDKVCKQEDCDLDEVWY